MAKPQKNNKEKQRILTPEFRVSYPHIFKPNSIKGSEPKYSIVMLFKKTTDLSVIKLAMKHAKIAEFGPDESEWPEELESPIVNGDKPKFEDRDGYKGCWAIKASANQDSKPGVVDKDVEPILEPGEFYPGCYARAQVFARVWEFGGKQGVHFILDHVQKTRDGKAFGGKKSAAEAFDPIDNETSDVEDEENIAF